jgi:hypothetical protein
MPGFFEGISFEGFSKFFSINLLEGWCLIFFIPSVYKFFILSIFISKSIEVAAI